MNKEVKMKFPLSLWAKWSLLVLLNSIASFIAALVADHNTLEHLLGMGLGIATFIAIYMVLEAWAISRARHSFIRSIKAGVILKMMLQLVPAVEVMAGDCAIESVNALGIQQVTVSTYLKTVLVGLILSCIVFMLASAYWYLRGKFTEALVPSPSDNS